MGGETTDKWIRLEISAYIGNNPDIFRISPGRLLVAIWMEETFSMICVISKKELTWSMYIRISSISMIACSRISTRCHCQQQSIVLWVSGPAWSLAPSNPATNQRAHDRWDVWHIAPYPRTFDAWRYCMCYLPLVSPPECYCRRVICGCDRWNNGWDRIVGVINCVEW